MKAIVLGGLILAAPLGLPASAGAALQSDRAGVELEAIQCWRRLGRNTVSVGERFAVTLTCSVVETDSARAVPDESGLAPEIIDVSPFEVVGGRRYADIRNGARRFFQYEYTLRIIGEDFFGMDVDLPALDIAYRIERNLGSGAGLPGRELTYILPPESVRVLSLVPEDRNDIRELPGETFGDVETRLFRANLMVLAAAALGITALGALIVAVVGARRARRGAGAPAQERLPPRTIVRRALKELTMLEGESREQGWTGELSSRALAAFRLAGSIAVSRPVTQAVVDSDVVDRTGQLGLRRGIWRPRKTLISSALTSDAIAREIAKAQSNHSRDPGWTGMLEDLHRALAAFTAARYGQGPDLAGETLTLAFDRGVAAVRQLRVRTMTPLREAAKMTRALRDWGRRVWPG